MKSNPIQIGSIQRLLRVPARHGTALNDALWLPTAKKGKNTSVELCRVQPIDAGIGLMGVNRSWYNTESTKYHGTGVRFGLTFGK